MARAGPSSPYGNRIRPIYQLVVLGLYQNGPREGQKRPIGPVKNGPRGCPKRPTASSTRKPCCHKKPRDAAFVLFDLNFADNIHYKIKSSQALKARLSGGPFWM